MRALALLPLLVLLVGCDRDTQNATTAEPTQTELVTPTPWLPGMPTPDTGTPMPTPERPVPAIDGEIPFCGFSIEWWDNAAPNTDARKCLLDAMESGIAEMVIVQWGPEAFVTTRLIVTPRAVQGIRADLRGSPGYEEQIHTFVQCEPLRPTGDEWVFEEPECTDSGNSSPRFEPLRKDTEQFCGLSQVRHSSETAHQAARQCLVDAFEAEAPARMIEVSLTVEGDPIANVFRVADGRLSIYMDSHDSLGYEGLFLYECARLERRDPPVVYRETDCTEPELIPTAR